MDVYKMNFRDFVNQDSLRKPINQPTVDEYFEDMDEEYQEQVKKPTKVQQRIIEEEYEEPDEDFDYEDEDDYYEEPVKHVHKPVKVVQKVVRQPQRPVVQQARPVQRVQKPTYRPGYAMPENQYRRPLAVTPKQLKETTIEGTANSLTEAIKRKVDTVFYRFGIQGLEKLDEKILDTIEELQYPEQKLTRRQLKEMRRVSVKKVKKYRPLPLEEITPVPEPEPIPEPIYEEPPVYEEPEYTEPMVAEEIEQEPVVETVEEPVVEEPVVEVKKPVISSPKPSFMQTKKEEKPIVIESTGDEDEDLINAAMAMDFSKKPEEKSPVISDDEMWNTVEAILESTPHQKLVHEPQTTSCLSQQTILDEQETQTDDKSEQVESTEEQSVVQPKPKRKRKQKTVEKTEEVSKTDEEN